MYSSSIVTVVENEEFPVEELVAGVSKDDAFTFMRCTTKDFGFTANDLVIVKKNGRDKGEVAKVIFFLQEFAGAGLLLKSVW